MNARVGVKVVTHNNGEFIIDGADITVVVSCSVGTLVVRRGGKDTLMLPLEDIKYATINKIEKENTNA